MKKNRPIYILGSGGFAKEVWLLIQVINENSPEFEFKGFIDLVTPENQNVKIGSNQFPILNEADFLATYQKTASDICLAVGMGQPRLIKKVTDRFKGFTFPNLFHPLSTRHFDSLQIGEGNIITAGSQFTVNINVGSFNIFNLNMTLGHDSVIENCNVFNPGCNISGGVRIGSENLIGTGSAILQNLKVGAGSILGAGAVLTENLADLSLAVGVPAKVIKTL
ncbi:MAG: hypothetical protein K2P92_06825 [Bdellovibrionaceae bacterium]|nr:hypothetical protein [Pseudobdellovibrionaceae bacterium]